MDYGQQTISGIGLNRSILSVDGQCGNLLKKVRARIKPNKSIPSVGFGEGETSAQYFELRIHGKSVNPVKGKSELETER